MSNFLNNNPFVELSAMETALGMPPSFLAAPAIAKRKKARRGASVSLLRSKLESSERMVKLLQEEISLLRAKMPLRDQVEVDQALFDRRKHP